MMFEDLETLLVEQGAALSDLLFYSIYKRDMRNFPVLARTRAARNAVYREVLSAWSEEDLGTLAHMLRRLNADLDAHLDS